MMIIGCDFHTRYQQIAMAEDSTGDISAHSGVRPPLPLTNPQVKSGELA
jgi:hypothetical protein